VFDDTRDGGDDEEDMSNQCDTDRDGNRLEPTPVGVGNVGAEERDNVDPRICYTPINSQGLCGTHQNELKVVRP